MRSEYLGDCIQFRDLPEAINKGQYLVPRLSKTEIKEVIEGPIKLIDKKISPILVNRLISEVGDYMDQLSTLQHALMRTYEEWKKKKEDQEINDIHYETVGTMEKSLANHAKEKFEELGNKNKTSDDQLSKK